mmetsp:Transcript_31113/g.85023  ORF Transcript_31113/g.85023 Transcript_31113/m.85023 type:complete len:499 (+) Transcript_31113:107-1603(+)
MSSVTWADKVDVSTYTDPRAPRHPKPPSLAAARRAFSEPMRRDASARRSAPETVPWDEGKRALMLTSPSGVSPVAKKPMRWSQSDDHVLLNDLMPEIPGSSIDPLAALADDNSEASDDTARNHTVDYFDFEGGSPPRKGGKSLFENANTVPEPTVEVDAGAKKDVPMWTVEEDLLILQLVERHGKRWSKIASHLPGRTDNGVRNRWNRMEKAQSLRSRHGAEHGYRCRRCGQPKRGHICAALTQGEQPEGDMLAKKAAALTALSAEKLRTMLTDKPLVPRTAPPIRTSRSMPNHFISPSTAPSFARIESAKPTVPPASKKLASGGVQKSVAKGKLKVESLIAMDDTQLDDFLTELHLSLATPTNADRMQHAMAMAAGIGSAPPVPQQSMPTMPPPPATRSVGSFSGAPAACIAAAAAASPSFALDDPFMLSDAPESIDPFALPPASAVSLLRGESFDANDEAADELVASMLFIEPSVATQPSTDTVLANAMPTVSLGE